jgi:hypothetical protein
MAMDGWMASGIDADGNDSLRSSGSVICSGKIDRDFWIAAAD